MTVQLADHWYTIASHVRHYYQRFTGIVMDITQRTYPNDASVRFIWCFV